MVKSTTFAELLLTNCSHFATKMLQKTLSPPSSLKPLATLQRNNSIIPQKSVPQVMEQFVNLSYFFILNNLDGQTSFNPCLETGLRPVLLIC